jgi:hypothetical protein
MFLITAYWTLQQPVALICDKYWCIATTYVKHVIIMRQFNYASLFKNACKITCSSYADTYNIIMQNNTNKKIPNLSLNCYPKLEIHKFSGKKSQPTRKLSSFFQFQSFTS